MANRHSEAQMGGIAERPRLLDLVSVEIDVRVKIADHCVGLTPCTAAK
jgi:hypothetical protein